MDEEYFEIAAKEVATRVMRPGLFAKAFSESDGDEKRALALYIKYRAKELSDEFAQSKRASDKRCREEANRLDDMQRKLATNGITLKPNGEKEFSCPRCKHPIQIIDGYGILKCPACKEFVYAPEADL